MLLSTMAIVAAIATIAAFRHLDVKSCGPMLPYQLSAHTYLDLAFSAFSIPPLFLFGSPNRA